MLLLLAIIIVVTDKVLGTVAVAATIITINYECINHKCTYELKNALQCM